MTTIRLYRAILEKEGCQAEYNEATRTGGYTPDRSLPHNDPRLLALRDANVELQNALTEAKAIIEATDSRRREVALRIAGERDVARFMLESLVNQGFEMLDSEGFDAGWTKNPQAMLDLLMDLDELRLSVRHTNPQGGWDDSGWILLVRGNSPEEMISDYTTNLEQYLKATFKYIKSFYDPTYII